MINVVTIKLYEKPPGRDGWVADVRMIDPDKGTTVTGDGFELWNWDKFFEIQSQPPQIYQQIGDRITEVLCEE